MMKRPLVMLTAAMCGWSATVGAQTVLQLDPAATYLRTSNDPAPGSLAFSLASIEGGLAGGDWIRFRQLGAWDNGPGGDTFTRLMGVLSNGSTLLGGSSAHRLPGALSAGPQRVSGVTHFSSLPTDIPEDFYVSEPGFSNSLTLEVPAGATHLFFTVGDSFSSDNTDPNRDFGVEITRVSAPTLPGTTEDLVLRTGVSGPPTATPDVKSAGAGAVIAVEIVSPFTTADGTLCALLLDTFPTGTQPPTIGFPGWWIGPAASTELLTVLASPAAWNATVPPGLAGLSVALQAGALSPLSRNGLYVTTHAHEIRL